jgi:hypothetical protein
MPLQISGVGDWHEPFLRSSSSALSRGSMPERRSASSVDEQGTPVHPRASPSPCASQSKGNEGAGRAMATAATLIEGVPFAAKSS